MAQAGPTPQSAPAAPQSIPLRQAGPHAAGLRQSTVKVVVLLVGGGLVCYLLWAPSKTPPPQRKAEAAPHLGSISDPFSSQQGYAKLQPPPLPAEPPPVPPTPPASQPASKPGLSLREQAEQKARLGGLGVGKPEDSSPQAAPGGQQPVMLQPPQGGAAGPVDVAGSALTPKEQFQARQATMQPTEVQDRLHAPTSPYLLQAGTWIPLTLEGAINSSLPGDLKGRVRRDLYDTAWGDHLLIPQNTVFIGRYDSRVVWGEDRVLVVWHRMILPENGGSIQLEGMNGVDLRGQSGLKDKVDNHYWQLLGAVLMSSVLSMGARVPFGTPGEGEYYQNLPQEFAQQFGQAANQAGQRIVQRQLNVPPTIMIRNGKPLNVFVHRDLVLQPYRRSVARRR